MSMSGDLNIQEIMLRYLNGESTAEEGEVLQHWTGESTANKEEFELTQRLWNDTAEAALLSVDTEKAWEKVMAKTIEKPAPVRSLFSWKKALSIAASVLLIAGAFYYFFQYPAVSWSVTLAENGNRQLLLSDGTRITLRKGAQLSLPSNYGSGERQVKLQGEAYFEITHDAQIPFSVVTDRSIVRDIGTAFLLQSSSSVDKVTVMEGEVSFAEKSSSNKLITLRAGESAILENKGPQKEKADTSNLMSWQSAVLIFNNTMLSKVAHDLSDYYSIEVEVPEALQTTPVTAEFRNEPLEQVIKELRMLTGLKVELTENKVVFTK